VNLKELITFQTIVREGTFAKAADKLHYAQSTVTSQIQRLEKETGIQLFNRNWDAELTDAGRVFAEEVERLIAHWQYVVEQAKQLQQEEIGRICVGGLETMFAAVFPNAMRRFRAEKPGVVCDFISGNTDFLAQSVLQRKLDFAVCGEPSDPGAFHFEPLHAERIAFIADQAHPLAGRRAVPLGALPEYPIAAGGPSCLYHLRLAKQWMRVAAPPRILHISPISAIPGFIAGTPLVGAVLESTPIPAGLVKLDVDWDGEDRSLPVGIVRLRTADYPSANIRLMIELIREETAIESRID
jgi:Transcriptional regulator